MWINVNKRNDGAEKKRLAKRSLSDLVIYQIFRNRMSFSVENERPQSL